MIVTITPNPFVTTIAIVKKFSSSQKIDSHRMYIQPGGGGVHVSSVIAKLGGKTKAFGFNAGGTGLTLLSLLKQDGIPVSFVEVDGETRNVLVIIQEHKGVVLRLRGPSPSVKEDAKRKLISRIKSNISSSEMLVVSGSFPQGVDENFLVHLVNLAKKSSIVCVIDTPVANLDFMLAQYPSFIKLSLSDYNKSISMAHRFFSIEDTILLLRKHMAGSDTRLIFSMGAYGCLLLESNTTWHFKYPEKYELKADGAGDVLIGVFSHHFSTTRDVIFSMKCGVCASALSVQKERFCDIEKNEVLSEQNNVLVTKYKH